MTRTHTIRQRSLLVLALPVLCGLVAAQEILANGQEKPHARGGVTQEATDRGIIIVGGNEAVPARASAIAEREAMSTSETQPIEAAASPAADRGIIIVGGHQDAAATPATRRPDQHAQPAQAEAAKSAAVPAATGTAASQPGSSSPAALNPQPLPPREADVKPRGQPEVYNGPARTRTTESRRGQLPEAPAATPGNAVLRDGSAERAVPRGETPLQTSPLGNATPATRVAGDLEIRTEDLVCQGGPGFRFENHGRDPETGYTRMRLYFSTPSRNARDRRPGAGADGAWLDPGTCAFVNREWVPGDPPGVQFETRTNDAERNVLKIRHGTNTGAEESPDSGSIPEYLRDERHYWRFAVYKTSYGHFHAVRHESWRPATGGTGAEHDQYGMP